MLMLNIEADIEPSHIHPYKC